MAGDFSLTLHVFCILTKRFKYCRFYANNEHQLRKFHLNWLKCHFTAQDETWMLHI